MPGGKFAQANKRKRVKRKKENERIRKSYKRVLNELIIFINTIN